MAVAGSLEIQMFAELTRLRKDMEKATGIVQKSSKQMESAAGLATKAFGLLGVSLGVAGFVHLIKGSIDAMDRLRDLSKTTNITVENLSGLQLAAKQSGGDLNSIADSINKLAMNMGKDAEKFRELGITAKEPMEAFKQLSDIFVKLEDPQQRAAVMAAALGRSWAGAAPLLSEGSAKIQEMVDKGARLSGVTQEMTEQADALNDKWAELTGTGGLLARMVGPMLPLLNLLADEMLKASESTNKLTTSVNPLAEILRVIMVLGSDVSFVLKVMGLELGAFVAQMAVLGRMGTVTEWRAISDAVKADTTRARAELDAFQKRVMEAGLTGTPAAAATGPVAGSGAAAANAAKFLGGDKDEKAAKEAAAREQAVRDAMHKVRIEDDARELAQVEVINKRNADAAAAEVAREQEIRDIMHRVREADNARELAQVDAQAAYKKARQDQEYADKMKFLGDLSGLMNTGSKEMFEIGKAASIATAVIKGYESAVSAYAAGSKIGGPWVGAAFAAASVLATGNMIANIKAQSFGGASGGGGGSIGVPIAPTQGASGIAPAANDSGRGQTTIYNLTGSSFSRAQVRELLEMQNENSTDGSRVIVNER